MTGGSTSGPENCAKRLNDESQQEQRHWFARRRYQRFPVGHTRSDFLMHYTKLIAPGKAPGGDHVGPMIEGFSLRYAIRLSRRKCHRLAFAVGQINSAPYHRHRMP
jgi:hypothetical protein